MNEIIVAIAIMCHSGQTSIKDQKSCVHKILTCMVLNGPKENPQQALYDCLGKTK